MAETAKFLTHQLVGENIWFQLKIDARLEEYDIVASAEEEPTEFLAPAASIVMHLMAAR